jgi:MFS family permease
MGTCLTGGKFFGTLIFGWLADKKGRIFAYKISGAIMFVFAVGVTASVDYYMLLPCLFFIGVGYGGDLCNTGTILTDNLPLSKRWVLTFVTISWACGSTILAAYGLILHT